ncbi:hypothetical protein V1511DRAFT_462663 [Dipodascopsis uninucleata]
MCDSDALTRYIEITELERALAANGKHKDAKVLTPLRQDIKEYWAYAKIADSNLIFVDIGLGLYIEMTFEEAKKWTQDTVARINGKIDWLLHR